MHLSFTSINLLRSTSRKEEKHGLNKDYDFFHILCSHKHTMLQSILLIQRGYYTGSIYISIRSYHCVAGLSCAESIPRFRHRHTTDMISCSPLQNASYILSIWRFQNTDWYNWGAMLLLLLFFYLLASTFAERVEVYNLIVLGESSSMDSFVTETVIEVQKTLNSLWTAAQQYANTQQHFITLLNFSSSGSITYMFSTQLLLIDR